MCPIPPVRQQIRPSLPLLRRNSPMYHPQVAGPLAAKHPFQIPLASAAFGNHPPSHQSIVTFTAGGLSHHHRACKSPLCPYRRTEYSLPPRLLTRELTTPSSFLIFRAAVTWPTPFLIPDKGEVRTFRWRCLVLPSDLVTPAISANIPLVSCRMPGGFNSSSAKSHLSRT
jgi:hypothetical protein